MVRYAAALALAMQIGYPHPNGLIPILEMLTTVG